jgi:eukaryotic-like serine/threonine-protein kinase
LAVKRYGDYEVVKYFATGGMADLYLARHPRQPRDVVIKTLQPRYVEQSRVVRMLLDEGRIARALEHPNVVKMLEIGEQGGEYFIVMEHIAGRDLLAVCRRGIEVGNFLSRPLAVAICEQALRGLEYAHEAKTDDGAHLEFVHRDISPGNLVVSWGGTVKIVDFGIAKAKIQLREDDAVAGKYNYMAPEQIRNERLDGRADVFALGVILYEITVGKRLFRGRPEQVMRMVLEEPIVPPSQLRPDFPAALEQVIMRALERDPAKRWPSARAMRFALKSWLAADGEPHGKRAIAEYLRAVFGAAKQRDADEFVSDHTDEELQLERALPGAAAPPLAVDPEDPDEDTAPSIKLPPPQEITAPFPRAAAIAGEDVTRRHAKSPPVESARYVIALFVACVLVAALLGFFLLRG